MKSENCFPRIKMDLREKEKAVDFPDPQPFYNEY